jgi:hypothetical protein
LQGFVVAAVEHADGTAFCVELADVLLENVALLLLLLLCAGLCCSSG